MHASSQGRTGQALTVSCDMTGVPRHGAQAGQQVAARLQPRRLGRVQPPQPRRCWVPAGEQGKLRKPALCHNKLVKLGHGHGSSLFC